MMPSLPSPTNNNACSPSNTSYLLPVDSSGLESREEGKKIKFTPGFKANEPTFWHVFKELANENNG